VGSALVDGEAVVVLVDDDSARIAIQLGHEFDIDLVGPRVLSRGCGTGSDAECGERLGGDQGCCWD
jgi:hypothetical protein